MKSLAVARHDPMPNRVALVASLHRVQHQPIDVHRAPRKRQVAAADEQPAVFVLLLKPRQEQRPASIQIQGRHREHVLNGHIDPAAALAVVLAAESDRTIGSPQDGCNLLQVPPKYARQIRALAIDADSLNRRRGEQLPDSLWVGSGDRACPEAKTDYLDAFMRIHSSRSYSPAPRSVYHTLRSCQEKGVGGRIIVTRELRRFHRPL